MTLHYSLDENDFLQHQLFAASKSKRIKRQRLRSWLVNSAALLSLAWMFYRSGNKMMMYYFLFAGLLFLCFYPIYQKRYYKKHWQKYVAETYKNRFGQDEQVTFTETYIETTDSSGESKIKLAEVESITETRDYFFVQLKQGGHLVIPKKAVDVYQVRNELKQVCQRWGIAFIEELKWR